MTTGHKEVKYAGNRADKASSNYGTVVDTVLGQQPEEIGTTASDIWSLRVMLVFFVTLFFVFSWSRGGMTLGMQAWRLRVQGVDGYSLNLKQCLIRCGVAWLSLLAFGLGYLWVLFDKQRRSWPDIASNTQTVVLPKK